jgi:hypothetical protein
MDPLKGAPARSDLEVPARPDRFDHIRLGLEADPRVTDHYCYAPDGERRWVVWGRGWERVFTTREAEAFLTERPTQ